MNRDIIGAGHIYLLTPVNSSKQIEAGHLPYPTRTPSWPWAGWRQDSQDRCRCFVPFPFL